MGSKSMHLLDSTDYFQIVLYCNKSCDNSYHDFRNLEVSATAVPIFQMWKMRLSSGHTLSKPTKLMRAVELIQIKLCLITKPTIVPQHSPSFCVDKALVNSSVKCQVQIFPLKCKPRPSTSWVLKNLDNSPILLQPSRLGKPLGRFVFKSETHSKRMGSELSRQWKIIPRSTH